MKLSLLPRPVFNSIPNPARSTAIFAAITALFFVAAIDDARAQTFQTWRGENTQGNLLDANAWWNFPNNSTMVFGQQEFDNNVQTTMTNNNGGTVFSTYRWLFKGGATTARTITGDGLRFFDFGGNDGGIYNESSATHIFNVAIEGDGTTDPFQIHLNNTGGLTFGSTVNNQGTNIDILGTASGAKTVTFSGVVSGLGGMFVNNANATVLFDAANSQSGQLTINAGTVRLGGAGDTFGASTQAIRIGTGASLDLNNVSTTVGSVGEEGSSDGGTISLGSATLTVGGSATTFQNSISGTGGITHSGSGTLNLYGSQSYSGTTSVSAGTISSGVAMSSAAYSITGTGTFSTSAANVISDTASMTLGGGTLLIGGAETFGNSGVTLSASSSSTISVGTSFSATVSGTVTGSGNVSKTGTGQLNLSGNNDYSGTTTLSAGFLEAQSANALGSTAAGTSVTSGATLKLFNATGFTSAAEALTINGSGVGSAGALLNEGGSNTYAGAITLGSTSRINATTNTTLTLDVASGSAISGSHALTFGGNGNIAVNDNIEVGANLITKDGNGRVTIAGTQTATGGITVSGGTLVYNASNSGSGAVTVNSGGTIAGTGSLGATTINSGGTMNPGSSPGTQTYATLAWGGGGNYNWQVYDAAGAAGTDYDTFVSTGAFTINATAGSKFNINLWTLSGIAPDVNGSAINFNSANNFTWTLGTFGSISGFAEDKFTINTGAANGTSGFANGFGGTFSINTNSTQLLLVYTAPVSNYDVTVTTGAADQGAGAGITGGAAQFTGTGVSLNKLGAGTLVMTNAANDYTGSTTIIDGAISINVAAPSGSAGALGNASSAVAVGTSTNAVATGFNFGAAVENARGLNIITGNAVGGTRSISTSIGSGTATQSGAVSLSTNTAIAAASGSTLLVSGALSGTGGANINGAGAVILSNNNTGYSGTVTLSSGAILRAANNGALGTGGLTLNGGTLTTDGANARILANNITIGGNVAFGDGSGTGNLTLNGTVGLGGLVRTLTVANNTTLGGAIGGTAGNGLTKAGNGTLTLSGANTFDGAVTINAGRLNVGGSSAIGNNAAVTVASDATFGLSALEEIGSLTGAGNVALGGLLIVGNNGTSTSYSGVMSGTDGFVKKGAGTTTFSGANNYSGETFIVGGAALYSVVQGGSFTNTINLGETNGTVSASLLLGATLNNPLTVRFGSSNNTLAVASSGAGPVTYGGNVNLFNNNFTIGQTAGGTGAVTFGSSTNTFSLGSDGTTTVRNVTINGSHTIAAQITGGANNALNIGGGGTLTLSGANAFSGGAQVTTGTILAGNNAALGTGTFTFNFNNEVGTRVLAPSSSAGFTLNNDFNVFDNTITIGQTEGGTGSLVLGGTGKNFNLGSDGEVKNRIITVNGSQTIAGNVIGGANNNFIKRGDGTLTLSGETNSFNGALLIDSGLVNLSGGNFTGSSSSLEIGGGANGNAVNASDAGLRVSAAISYGRNIIVNAETNSSGSSGNRAIDFFNSTGSGTLTGTVAIEKTIGVNVTNSAATGVLSGVVSGVGGLTKTGLGTLTLSGSAANSYSGLTTVSAGTLNLNKTTGDAIVGNVTVNSGAVLLLSASNQVDSGATDVVTLSGGTIQRASGVSEVFGDLNVTQASFLDYSAGTGGTITFTGLDYTPSAILSLQLVNFTQGNTLVFQNTTDMSSLVGTGFTFGGSGGFGGTSFSGSTFTITAIPEPSTYLAAAGLLALFLWPVRRRLLKDAKSILGLRAPARDRLEAYRNA